MPDLILHQAGLGNNLYCLQLRYHNCRGPIDYKTLCYVEESVAREIISAGGASWLYGDPRADQASNKNR